MLDDLCWWWAQLRRIQKQLEILSPAVRGFKDVLSAAGQTLDRVIKIAERFGLTPADRAKLGVVNAGPPVAKVPVRQKTKLDQQGPPK
jgi:phage terminase small subunit